MGVINISINPGPTTAHYVVDKDGQKIALDKAFADKVIQRLLPDFQNSIIGRTASFIDYAVLQGNEGRVVTLTFAKTDWVKKIYNRTDFAIEGNAARTAGTKKITKFEISSGPEKGIELIKTKMIDAEKLGIYRDLDALIAQDFRITILNSQIAQAHYSLDKKTIDTALSGAVTIFEKESGTPGVFVDITPDEMTPDEMMQVVLGIRSKADQLIKSVTQFHPGVSRKDVVIEVNNDLARNFYKVNQVSGASNMLAALGIAFDPKGNIIAFGNYSLFVDDTQPTGCYVRVRAKHCLISDIALDKPYTTFDGPSQEQAVGNFFLMINGVDDVEFISIGVSRAYNDEIAAGSNNPTNALFTPYFGNPSPQTEPFATSGGTQSAGSQSASSSSVKHVGKTAQQIIDEEKAKASARTQSAGSQSASSPADKSESTGTTAELSADEKKKLEIKRISQMSNASLIAEASKKQFLKEKLKKDFKNVSTKELKDFLISKI